MRFDSPCSEMVYDAGAYRARDMANVGWYEYFYGLQRDIPEFTCGTTLYQEAKQIVDAMFLQSPGRAGI